MRLHQIRGIQMHTAERLAAEGVKTSEALLEAGKTVVGRKELAAKVGADPKEILELVNRADLARIRGIGEVYSNLLENAGVDTVAELAKRVPANLHAKLLEQTQAGDARPPRPWLRLRTGSGRPRHWAGGSNTDRLFRGLGGWFLVACPARMTTEIAATATSDVAKGRVPDRNPAFRAWPRVSGGCSYPCGVG